MSHLNRPMIMSQGVVRKLVTDPDFYKQIPEFVSLRTYQEKLKSETKKSGGCSGCKQKRVEFNTMSAFIYVLASINEEAAGRLKRFLGVEKIQYHGFNKNKGSYELREL